MRLSAFLVASATLLQAGGILAQSNERPRFEVASIKPNKSGQLAMSAHGEPGGRFVAQNLSLKDLVALAYKVRDFQISGGPSWMSADRFDVIARADRDLPPLQVDGRVGPLELMLQSLLVERFKLVARTETQERPLFTLVMARSDRRLGDKLQPSTVDCAAMFAERARSGGPAPGPLMGNGRPTCGMAISPWAMRLGGVPMSQFVSVLAQMTNRFVVDQTGLSGQYDIDLQWTPPGARGVPPGDAAAPAVPVPAFNANGATLETALQEQLGLKLEPQRGPVPIVVIESAEQPTPD